MARKWDFSCWTREVIAPVPSHPQPVLPLTAAPVLMPNMHLTGSIASGLGRFSPRREGSLGALRVWLEVLFFFLPGGEGGA